MCIRMGLRLRLASSLGSFAFWQRDHEWVRLFLPILSSTKLARRPTIITIISHIWVWDSRPATSYPSLQVRNHSLRPEHLWRKSILRDAGRNSNLSTIRPCWSR
ncbi:hypothetical protein AA313_de0202063 [Arthrobotrys entomopaga]|nr:hypothetical protein AA313_de0202063 [Arthrobotrys entomopaga]